MSLSEDHHAPAWRGLLTDGSGLLYAALWAMRGAQAARTPLVPSIVAVAVISLLLLGGFARRDLILKRPETIHHQTFAKRAKIGRIMALILVGNGCHMLHRPDLMIPLIGLVIGLAYIPLGIAMREPIHLVVGAAIVAVTLISFLFSSPLHQTLAGFGTAAIVWAGCAGRLWRTERLRENSTPLAQPA